jgi:hypothetical protein
MHTIQDRNDVILIMYNQSNVTLTYLKCRTKLIYLFKKSHITT